MSNVSDFAFLIYFASAFSRVVLKYNNFCFHMHIFIVNIIIKDLTTSTLIIRMFFFFNECG